MKNKLLLKLLASTILMITSGFSFFTYALVILSSLVNGDIEYAPGRSTAMCDSSPAYIFFIGRSFLSTVTPAQFPTFSLDPVRALYIVVLPELGLPIKAILILFLLFYLIAKIFFLYKLILVYFTVSRR